MHYVFLIHGMGSSSTGWSKNAKKLIEDHYDKKAYAFLADFPLSDIKFVEINYNDIFDAYLDEAKQHAADLGSWGKLVKTKDPTMSGVLGRIVGIAAKEPAKSFLITHLADVAFFMATDLGWQVRARIAEQMGAALKDLKAKDSWSIIAHSLGTRVATEVLQIGFTGAPSLASFGKARFVMMVANTSYLLQELSPYNAGDVYTNIVYPARKAMGVCHRYINVSHELDPFSFIKRFDPPSTWGNGEVFTQKLYHPILLQAKDLTSKEVHSLEHYLRHPQVHTTLFRFLVDPAGRLGPTEREMKAQMDIYTNETLAAQITAAWRTSIAALRDGKFETAKEIFDTWEKFGALVS
ncbi:MAG TPA: hypothetical protein VF211_05845 [Burkholderiales bacterium]